MNKAILTKKDYWGSINDATKSYWQSLANRTKGATVCTHRPEIKKSKGNENVRRCSTGGKYGKSADVVKMDISSLLNQGYVFETYTARNELLEKKRSDIYNR